MRNVVFYLVETNKGLYIYKNKNNTKAMIVRQTKFTRYQKLRELGYNYNWKTVSDKTLKAKLKELKIK